MKTKLWQEITPNKEVKQYWREHISKIVRLAKKANPDWTSTETKENESVENAFTRHVMNLFVEDVSIYMQEGLTLNEAVSKELRSREFKSSANFYAESVMDKLKKYYSDEISFDHNRYRDSKGRFISDPTYQITYLGEIYFEDKKWNGYSFVNKYGIIKFFYEAGSPNMDTYQTMVLDEVLS